MPTKSKQILSKYTFHGKVLLVFGGCVLNLAGMWLVFCSKVLLNTVKESGLTLSLTIIGLWGGERDPRNWIDRVAKTKDDVRNKKSLHMIHGIDVARAIIAVMCKLILFYNKYFSTKFYLVKDRTSSTD